jgi:hypothetical protein
MGDLLENRYFFEDEVGVDRISGEMIKLKFTQAASGSIENRQIYAHESSRSHHYAPMFSRRSGGNHSDCCKCVSGMVQLGRRVGCYSISRPSGQTGRLLVEMGKSGQAGASKVTEVVEFAWRSHIMKRGL